MTAVRPAAGGSLVHVVTDRALALISSGPADHGITRVARQIADAATDLGFGGTVLHEPDPAAIGELVDRLPPESRLVHLHVNDWLFGDGRAGADERITALAGALRRRGAALTVTLHDLPQVSDPPELFRRRANTYRTIVRQAAGVVVSSEHERALLAEAWVHVASSDDAEEQWPAAADVRVIPLPIDSTAPGARPNSPADPLPTVGIFGYLYPGKGHRQVLEELAGIRPAVTVLAIGQPSGRHAELLPRLRAVAERGHLGFRCTGWVADADVVEQLRSVAVPLAPHTHVSASGSINSWIAAGRRPLVPAGRYVLELDGRLPGSVRIYQPGRLRRAVERALAEPESTWLPTGFRTGPTTSQVAASYLGWLRVRMAAQPVTSAADRS